jgi:hypothetical protein
MARRKSTTEIILDWQLVADDRDPCWAYTRAVYAYLTPRGAEVLYIGKADGCSVRDRWRGKTEFWLDLENMRGIMSHRVIVSDILSHGDCRLTRELLSDVESLLICELKPWGNVQCQLSRISRPGLKVVCRGAWPLSTKVFSDNL